MPDFFQHYGPILAHAALAVFGALVNAAKSHRSGETKTLLDFISLVFMSSFSGVMFAIIGLELFGQNSYITAAMAGTGGYLGVEGLSYIITYTLDRFNIKTTKLEKVVDRMDETIEPSK